MRILKEKEKDPLIELKQNVNIKLSGGDLLEGIPLIELKQNVNYYHFLSYFGYIVAINRTKVECK